MPRCGKGAVRADAAHLDRHHVGTGGDIGLGNVDPPGFELRHDVEGDGVIGLGKARVEPVGEHRPGAGDGLLGGLDDQDQGAVPAGAPRRQLAGGTDHGGDVHIMAAGMHHRLLDPGHVGLPDMRWIGHAGPFLERQAIHVGAEHDSRSGAVAQDRDHAGAADPGGHLIPQRAQLLRHAGRRVHLAAGKLRIAVEMVEQGSEAGRVVARHRLVQRAILRLGRRLHRERRDARRDHPFPHGFPSHRAPATAGALRSIVQQIRATLRPSPEHKRNLSRSS